MDVASYLRSKGMETKPATGRNIHTHCIFCNEERSARGRLYISVDPDAEVPGLYTCFRCGAKGNLVTLKRHFGESVAAEEADSAIRSEILDIAADYYHARLADFPEVFAYLQGPQRGLQPETITRYRIGYAPMEITYDVATKKVAVRKPNRLYSHLRSLGYLAKDVLATGLCQEHAGSIVDSLHGMVTIPYAVAGNCVAVRGRTWPHTPADFVSWPHERYDPPKAKYKTPGGTRARLFNTDAVWAATEVVVTEGEFDALAVEQAGWAAVGVPGASLWQDEWDDYLAGLRRIWVIFDRDPAGEKGAAALTARFAPRARRVHLSPENVKCDPSSWFGSHSPSEFAELLAEASKSGLLVTVADAIAEFERVQGEPGLRFGWERLDLHLRPGLQSAQVLVLLARTNAGKTIWLLNMMQRIRMVPGQHDKKLLFVSLEQTRGEWWDRARRIYRFYHLDHTEADAARFWQNHLMLVDRNRLTEAEMYQVLEDFEDQMNGLPDLVLIDYLGYWSRSFKGEAYERSSAAIMALKSMAKQYRVPLIVPHQVSRVARDGEEFQADAARDSVAGSTLITLADGRRVPIRDLVGTQPEVVVLGHDYVFTTRRAHVVWCKGERPVFDVAIRSGRRLSCTASHPLLTVDGWRRLEQLVPGDMVAIPRRLRVDATAEMAGAELIGAILAKGTLLNHAVVQFTEQTREIRDRVCALAAAIGLKARPKRGRSQTITFGGGPEDTVLFDYLRHLGCANSTGMRRRVPVPLWNANAEDVAAFIRGYWSCNGAATNRGVFCTTPVEQMARELAALLLRFGIRASINEQTYGFRSHEESTYWRLSVRRGVDVDAFAKSIGLIGRKGTELNEFASIAKAKYASKYEALPPQIWGRIQSVRESKGIGWREAFGNSGVVAARSITMPRAQEIAERLDDQWLRQLANGDIVFERIESITPAGIEPVYDMTVRGVHNFVGNEIVVSNSGIIEETADFVLVMWRPDDQMGVAERDRTGDVHFKIAKSRHGGRHQEFKMQWSPVSLTLVPELDPLCARARRELELHRIHGDETWDQIMLRHRSNGALI